MSISKRTEKTKSLLEELKVTDTDGHPSDHIEYLFSNELMFFPKTIPAIRDAKPMITKPEQTRVAVMIGESNLLSMLPELALHTDLVVCADINSLVNIHTAFMLKCLNNTSSTVEFIQMYEKQHPLSGITVDSMKIKFYSDSFYLRMKTSIKDNENHFLHSEERFHACKKAAENLMFTTLNLDMFDNDRLFKLSKLLSSHNAIITVMNLTNLQHYDKNSRLQTNPLLQNNTNKDDTLILYSVGHSDFYDKHDLLSRISVGTKQYTDMLSAKYSIMETDKSVTPKLIEDLNIAIKNLAAEMKLDENYIPKAVIEYKKDLWRKPTKDPQIAIHRGQEKSDLAQYKQSEVLWFNVLKGTMNYWVSHWYFPEEMLKQKDKTVLDPRRVREYIKNVFEKNAHKAIEVKSDKTFGSP